MQETAVVEHHHLPIGERDVKSQENKVLHAKKLHKKKKFLIFTLDEERYAIPLSVVKEIIGMTDITPLLHVPKYFRGLINLRGRIFSVIDLRLKLSLSGSVYQAKKTSIIIYEHDDFVVGMIVDDVIEVIGIENDQITQNVKPESIAHKEFVDGVARTDENTLIIMLDVSKMINQKEMESHQKLSNNNAA